jgi:hypothetical protein
MPSDWLARKKLKAFGILYIHTVYWHMRFKSPLTKTDLHAIKERSGGAPDVAALLWEIARLRGTVLYADQLQRLLGTLSGPQGQVLEALRSILVEEPCVKEFPRRPPSC